MASREASWEIDSKASFPQAPYDSTTNGTQTQSSSLHLVSLDECFLSSVVSAATPVVTLASNYLFFSDFSEPLIEYCSQDLPCIKFRADLSKVIISLPLTLGSFYVLFE